MTSWHIKLAEIGSREESGINIGVAPFDIDQNCRMNVLNVGGSTIVTPQVYVLGILVSTEKKPYGPRKGNGECMK